MGRATFGPSIVAVVLAFAAHINTLWNPFVYDDHVVVLWNPSIRELGDVGTVLRGSIFRPLVNLSYAVDHAIWGLDPLGYHLTNIGLHSANVFLVTLLTAVVVRDSSERRADPRKPSAGAVGIAALTTGGLFAVHPMMTGAVGYIGARADLLSGTLLLAAALTMRQALRGGPHRSWFLVVSLVAWGLGIAAKEVALMAPFLFLAYDRLLLPGPSDAARRRLWRLHAPLLALAMAAGIARVVVFVGFENPSPTGAAWRMALYLASQFEVIWRYIFLLTVPVGQSVFHLVEIRVVEGTAALVWLIVLCGVAYRMRRRAPTVAFGLAWFLLLLAPTSSLIPLQYLMAEHRVYLASVGLFVVVGAGVAVISHRIPSEPRRYRCLPYVVVALVLVTLAYLAAARNSVWADPVALWRDAATKAPHWESYYALGEVLRDEGRCEEAIPAYEAAIRLAPHRVLPHARLRRCLLIVGRFDEAATAAQGLVAVDPEFKRLCTEFRLRAPLALQVPVEECQQRYRAELGQMPIRQ